MVLRQYPREHPAPFTLTVGVLNVLFEQEATARMAFNKITENFVGADLSAFRGFHDISPNLLKIIIGPWCQFS